MNRIFYNGNIITMENLEDGSLQKVDAMWVKDGDYAAVGTLDEVRRAAGTGAEEIDLDDPDLYEHFETRLLRTKK